MADPLFPETGSAFRDARLQLGWSQELFAEKAIVSVSTIKAAEAGNGTYPTSHKALVDAINKGRAASLPPVAPLVLPYPVESAPEPAAGTAPPPLESEGRGTSESVGREPPAPTDDDRSVPPPIPPVVTPEKDTGEPPIINWLGDRPLLELGVDPWRIKDACEGVVIFGATGSGKTSGSGRTLALSYLTAGFGGLVLCAKPEESKLWKAYAKHTGRESDLVLFGTDPAWSFNFLQHEALRQGPGAGLTENIVNMFTEIASNGAGTGIAADQFWEQAMKSLVRNCVELLVMVKEPVSLHTMFELVRSAPTSTEEGQKESWRKSSVCWQFLQRAEKATTGTPTAADYREVAGFWMSHFPKLGDRTRGSIVLTFMTLAEGLMRAKMRTLFCSSTSLSPEDVLDGQIIVIDLPVKEWDAVGRTAAVLWKYCLQKAIERRTDNADGNGRPVFIWADECQYFVSKHDDLFQATARSSRASTVYLTQSIPTLVAAMGGEKAGSDLVDSLLNHFGTKIFHANSDRTTNEFASTLIGKKLQNFRTEGHSSSSVPGHFFSSWTKSSGYSEQFSEIVRPEWFAMLEKGGPDNGFQVRAVIVQTGRRWGRDRSPYSVTTFHQNLSFAPTPPPLVSPTLSTPSLPSRVVRLLFPWIDHKQGEYRRWLAAGCIWYIVASILVLWAMNSLSNLPENRQAAIANTQKSQQFENPAPSSAQPVPAQPTLAASPQAPAVAAPPPQVPIPLDVELTPNQGGSHGTAVFVTTTTKNVEFTAKVTSHPSGRIRQYNFMATTTISPSLNGRVGPGVDDGDEIELSNPEYKPFVVTFHHPNPFPPIPVDVEFTPNSGRSGGEATFVTTANEPFDVIVKVTSLRLGTHKTYHLNMWKLSRPSIGGRWDEVVEDGDEIEVLNSDYKPQKVTVHYAGMGP